MAHARASTRHLVERPVGTGTATRRILVAVHPPEERQRRRLLFDALEESSRVRFVAAASDTAVIDARIALGAEALALLDRTPDVPLFAAPHDEATTGGRPTAAHVPASPFVDQVLWGARLHDAHVTTIAPDLVRPTDEPVCLQSGLPIWAARIVDGTWVHLAPAALELSPGEALRERLRPGRSLALLALMQFLRTLSGPLAWSPPQLRAAFLFDDPNLHWPTYGHLRFGEVARHAADHRYHLAVAMVPLDGWFAHGRAVDIFRRHFDRLSIVVHGNDHRSAELARPQTVAEARTIASHALARIGRFEARTGLGVARVMAPPHERLSEQAATGLRDCGYEAICMSRPYPWVATPGRPWLARPSEVGALAAWEPTDRIAEGLPVLLRAGFSHPREDLVLRAFLGQSLILYGHHEDLADGLDLLAEAAADVNKLGDVRWGRLDELARASFESRRDGATLEVRMLARRVTVEVPEGVSELRVQHPGLFPGARLLYGEHGADPIVAEAVGGTLEARQGARIVLEIEGPRPPGPAERIRSRRRLWPLARRVAGEGRDRLRPVVGAWRS